MNIRFQPRSVSLSVVLAMAVVIVAVCIPASSAKAQPVVPGTYLLFDHGYGNLGPDYGFRYDALGKVFSLELGAAFVTLDWDGGTTALLSGTLHDNALGDIWSVSYTVTGVGASGSGFVGSGGTGTLTDHLSNVYSLSGEQNGHGNSFVFLGDGHRLPGDSSTPVGRGWLLPSGSTDDFLFRAEAYERPTVPEPSAALLLGLGMLGAGLIRRKRRA